MQITSTSEFLTNVSLAALAERVPSMNIDITEAEFAMEVLLSSSPANVKTVDVRDEFLGATVPNDQEQGDLKQFGFTAAPAIMVENAESTLIESSLRKRGDALARTKVPLRVNMSVEVETGRRQNSVGTGNANNFLGNSIGEYGSRVSIEDESTNPSTVNAAKSKQENVGTYEDVADDLRHEHAILRKDSVQKNQVSGINMGQRTTQRSDAESLQRTHASEQHEDPNAVLRGTSGTKMKNAVSNYESIPFSGSLRGEAPALDPPHKAALDKLTERQRQAILRDRRARVTTEQTPNKNTKLLTALPEMQHNKPSDSIGVKLKVYDARGSDHGPKNVSRSNQHNFSQTQSNSGQYGPPVATPSVKTVATGDTARFAERKSGLAIKGKSSSLLNVSQNQVSGFEVNGFGHTSKTDLLALDRTQDALVSKVETSIPTPGYSRTLESASNMVPSMFRHAAESVAEDPMIGAIAIQNEANESLRNLDAKTLGSEVAKNLASSAAEVARLLHEGSLELKMSPEELGRVRLSLVPSEGGLSVQILAEHQWTLDLIRRHIDLLESELRSAGYTGLTFLFGEEDASNDQMPNAKENEARDPSSKAENISSDIAGSTSQALSSRGRLDLKL